MVIQKVYIAKAQKHMILHQVLVKSFIRIHKQKKNSYNCRSCPIYKNYQLKLREGQIVQLEHSNFSTRNHEILERAFKYIIIIASHRF
jgi:hypothetical protein